MSHLSKIEFLLTSLVLVLFVGCNSFSTENTHEQIVYSMNGTLWVMNPDGTEQHALLQIGMLEFDPQWSPDGRQLVFTSMNVVNKCTIWIADADGQNPRVVSPTFDYITAKWLNPNVLLTLVVTDTGQTWNNPRSQFILDLHSEKMIGYSADYTTPRPLQSGKQWLFDSSDGIVLQGLTEDPKVVLQDYPISGPWSLDVSPSGDEMAFYGAPLIDTNTLGAHAVYRVRTNGENQVVKIIEFDGSASVRWSPNGKWIAVMDPKKQLRIIDAENNTIHKTHQPGLLAPAQDLHWSPDSQWILVAHVHYDTPQRTNTQELAKINRETGEIVRLTNNDQVETSPDWRVVQK